VPLDQNATTTWGAGDYPLMAERLEPVARELVELASIRCEDHVLDLGCGTGTAALIAAARGARVVRVDFEPALLSIAEQRGRSQAATARWVLADLASATVPEGAFSVVISAFGAMYSPDADQAAAAIARYCAPGARIALAAWTPSSFMPAMGATLAQYLPRPPAASPIFRTM
jgi:ubiquinone/menaquinone biosynthesis C-methylase UbiE